MLLFDYIKGIVRYEIEIENAEDFINDIKCGVSIKNLAVKQPNIIKITCFCCEQGMMESEIEKNNGKIIKRKKLGIPVFVSKIRHRAGLAAGCILSALLIMISSLFVWEIRVEGNEKLSEKTVVEMLERAGFREGMMKKKVDVKKVTDRLLINEDEVSWMSINFDGTVAHVEMKEAKIAKPYPKKENVNLVASTNGIILRVDALEGGTKVSKGETVIKGQLLVSAFVDKRTGGSLLRGARGFVWANTKRSFCVVVPLEYAEKKYTENTDVRYRISFLGKYVSLSNPVFKGQTRSDLEKISGKLKVSQNTVLPIAVDRMYRREFSEYSSRRTHEMALDIARKTALERLYETSIGFTLADTVEEYDFDESRLVYKCSFEGVENIAKELEFELS